MEQSEFRSWRASLKQYYIRTRKSVDGLKVAFQGAHRRNYGYGPELQTDGVVRLVHHPGEIWFKHDLDKRTPWIKIDVRRNCTKRHQNQRVVGADGVTTNILTCDLPRLKTKTKPKDEAQTDRPRRSLCTPGCCQSARQSTTIWWIRVHTSRRRSGNNTSIWNLTPRRATTTTVQVKYTRRVTLSAVTMSVTTNEWGLIRH